MDIKLPKEYTEITDAKLKDKLINEEPYKSFMDKLYEKVIGLYSYKDYYIGIFYDTTAWSHPGKFEPYRIVTLKQDGSDYRVGYATEEDLSEKLETWYINHGIEDMERKVKNESLNIFESLNNQLKFFLEDEEYHDFHIYDIEFIKGSTLVPHECHITEKRVEDCIDGLRQTEQKDNAEFGGIWKVDPRVKIKSFKYIMDNDGIEREFIVKPTNKVTEEVVDFMKYKKVKDAIKGAEDDTIHIKIEGVNTQNYNIDGVAILESQVLYDFKTLQTIFYALDKLQEDENIPFKYRVGLLSDEFDNGRFIHEGYITIGQGSARANMLNELEPYMDKVMNKTVIFDGDIVPSESDVQKKIIELQNLLRKERENNIKTDLAPAKDYSNGGKKFGQDVETGDILYYSFNYGSTQHYFIKVLERKGQTLKLARLEKSVDLINDDDGRVVPSNKIIPDRDIDGKPFRVHKSKADWDNVVCKVDGRNCYYWDGKPKRETYMD